MSICGKITKNRNFNCAAPLTGGVRDSITILNFEDLDTLTRDVTNPQVIRAINMVGVTKGFKWEGPKNSVEAIAKLIRKKYKNVYEQSVALPIMENTNDLKAELQKAGLGKFVVIVENNHQFGDAIFEIYGLERGLELLEAETNKNDADTDGAYKLKFGQDDLNRESNWPASFAILTADATPVYSYSLTKAALTALISAT